IREISFFLIRNSNGEENVHEEIFNNPIINSHNFQWLKDSQLEARISRGLKNYDKRTLRSILDHLFFQLFDLNETEIIYLLNKYYTL
ncbi:hypothetical protein LCGC14_2054660, partial [marine sediment metagenome]